VAVLFAFSGAGFGPRGVAKITNNFMGLRGPPPKPTALRILEGNPARRPLNSNEPQPRKLSQVDPPSDLPEEGKAVFRSLSKELIACGLMTSVDVEPFYRYVKLLLEYRHADREVGGKYVIPFKDEGGRLKYFLPNPWLSIRDKAMDRLLRLEKEFGMTPSSRVRMVAIMTNPEAPESFDPYDDDEAYED
jgi:P27 family predicted phage terminase small subunit